MFNIEEMNLYKTTDRFLNNYKHLKNSLKIELLHMQKEISIEILLKL